MSEAAPIAALAVFTGVSILFLLLLANTIHALLKLATDRLFSLKT